MNNFKVSKKKLQNFTTQSINNSNFLNHWVIKFKFKSESEREGDKTKSSICLSYRFI